MVGLLLWKLLLAGLAWGQEQELRQGAGSIDHTHTTRCCGTWRGKRENIASFLSLAGTQVPNTGQNFFYAFRGIPYARPLTPTERFKDAEPPFASQGGEASRAKAACPRAGGEGGGYGRQRQSEDCLYLNIFTKNLKQSRQNPNAQGSWSDIAGTPLRPVIVFIAGPETEGGAPSLGGQLLLREEVVVVTVEYRSGLLGFLSDGTKQLPGNLGLGDVRTALQWVQQNIHDFGGNKDKVVLAGHGQAAAIAHLLALNPNTARLFSKLILASGSALCEGGLNSPSSSTTSSSRSSSSSYSSSSYSSSSYSSMPALPTLPELPHPYYTYKAVLSATRCSSLRCLREKPLQELMRAQETLEKDRVGMTTVFTPTIDAGVRREAMVPRDPRRLLQDQATHRLPPLLISATRDEGFSAAAAFALQHPDELSRAGVREKLVPRLLGSVLGARRGRREEVVEVVFRQYFAEVFGEGGRDTGDREQVQEALAEMLGDLLVHSCIRETIQLHRKGDVYSYLFSYTEAVPMLGQFNQYSQQNQFRRSQNYVQPGGAGVGKVERGADIQLILPSGAGQAPIRPSLGGQALPGYMEGRVSGNLTALWSTFASGREPSIWPPPLVEVAVQPFIKRIDMARVEGRGTIATFNISLDDRAGIITDFRKSESVFWQHLVPFLEQLSAKLASLKGYAVATWGLLALMAVAGMAGGALALHLRRRGREDEQAMEGRDYAAWVSSMNNLKKADSERGPQQNNYEVK